MWLFTQQAAQPDVALEQHPAVIGTATAASLAAIVILTAAAPNVTTHVSFLAVVIAGPIYVLWAVLQQDLQKISQAGGPVVCAVTYMLPALAAAPA